jgi:D-beta-D-heptose 7-phosphate kinase/D-beta-D-heptose 1-phosphate adenosyltransferase
VAVDGDSKVMKDKGMSRPYMRLEDRVTILKSIKYVDTVLTFHTAQGLANLVCINKPDFLVVGSDWKGKLVVGSEYVKEVKYFDRLEGYSTTKIIKNIITRGFVS